MTFDLNKFRKEAQHVAPSTPQRRKANQRKGVMFLKGPISWEWLSIAGKLSGKALHVAIVLWLIFGLTKSETVKIQHKLLDDLGVSRKSYYNAIRHLQEAGLISVEKRRGARHEITLQGLKSKG